MVTVHTECVSVCKRVQKPKAPSSCWVLWEDKCVSVGAELWKDLKYLLYCTGYAPAHLLYLSHTHAYI